MQSTDRSKSSYENNTQQSPIIMKGHSLELNCFACDHQLNPENVEHLFDANNKFIEGHKRQIST